LTIGRGCISAGTHWVDSARSSERFLDEVISLPTYALKATQSRGSYEALDASMKRELDDVGWWFDTVALTPEQTADRIVGEAATEPS